MYEFDILQENMLSEVLKEEEPTSCIHAASLVMDRKSVEEPIRYIINNVQGTQSLLSAIRQTDTIRQFVILSSRSAVGETYAADDKMTENDLLRPTNPYGATKVSSRSPMSRFLQKLRFIDVHMPASANLWASMSTRHDAKIVI